MWRSFLKASLLLVMVLLWVSVPTVNAEGVNWTSPTTRHLRSVFMVNAIDGWAVGWDGTIIQWTGTEWIIPEFPTAILVPLLISLTLVAVILAKTRLKMRRSPSLPSKTQL